MFPINPNCHFFHSLNLVNSKRGELLFLLSFIQPSSLLRIPCTLLENISYSPYMLKRHRILFLYNTSATSLFYVSSFNTVLPPSFLLYILWVVVVGKSLPSKIYLLCNCALSTFLIDSLIEL